MGGETGGRRLSLRLLLVCPSYMYEAFWCTYFNRYDSYFIQLFMCLFICGLWVHHSRWCPLLKISWWKGVWSFPNSKKYIMKWGVYLRLWRGHLGGIVGGINNENLFFIVQFLSILITQKQQRWGRKGWVWNLRGGLIYWYRRR